MLTATIIILYLLAIAAFRMIDNTPSPAHGIGNNYNKIDAYFLIRAWLLVIASILLIIRTFILFKAGEF